MKIGFDIDGCMNNSIQDLKQIIKKDFNIIVPENEYSIFNYLNIPKEKK